MADGIRGMLDQLGRGRPSSFAADAAAVLRQLEDRVGAVQRAAAGDPRAFLSLAARVTRRLGGPAPGEAPAESEAGSAGRSSGPSIILP
jgi:hypothetical protein